MFHLIVHNRAFLRLIGWLNRRWHFLSTLFVMYPATEEYTRAYGPKRMWHIMRWSPWLVGFYVQDGTVGLSAVISSTEGDFRDPANLTNLRGMADESRAICDLVGASQLSFAGILPGVLNSHRIIKGSVEAKVAVEAVAKAEEALRASLGLTCDTPIVLLGANGFIGRRIARRLSARVLYMVDPTLHPHGSDGRWQEIRGRRTIVLNVATARALRDIAEKLWPEAIVLNEAYPEPDAETVAALQAMGCAVYHIAGLRGLSFPPFPKAYRGGIPSCAGHVSSSMRPVILNLDPSERK